MTKDGVVVVAHDDDIFRLCGVKKRVDEFNFDELPPISRRIPLHFSEGEYVLMPEEDGKFTTLR